MKCELPRPSSLFFGRELTDRQKTTVRLLAFGAAVLILAGLGLVWRSSATAADKPEPSPAARSLPVDTVVAKPVAAYELRRSYTGALVAGRSTDLSFQRAGKLLAVEVEEGSRVSAGEPLAALDKRHLLARRRQLEAERAQAVAVLAELVAGPRKETIDAARAEVRNSKAQLELRQSDYQRAERLLGNRAVSQAEFDAAAFGVRSSAAQAEALERKLEELVAGTREERIQAQQAAVDVLDARLDDLAIDIEDSALLAPFDGTVTTRYIDEGTVVSPASPIVRLVEDERLEARIGLPVHAAARLEAGQSHAVMVNGRSYEAVIAAVVPELDPATRTQTVILSVGADPTRVLVSGQVVRIETAETIDTRGYWLPTTALARGARGLWSCFAVTSDETGVDRIERRDIELLHTESERVLVRGALRPGDRLVAGGTHRLVAGQQVRSIKTLDPRLLAGS